MFGQAMYPQYGWGSVISSLGQTIGNAYNAYTTPNEPMVQPTLFDTYNSGSSLFGNNSTLLVLGIGAVIIYMLVK